MITIAKRNRFAILVGLAVLYSMSLMAQFPFAVERNVEESGFELIFNGSNLDGWKYDPAYWRVENGVMVGEITPETILDSNSFIIWTKEQPADFELKMDFRVSKEGNSGINYRSSKIENVYALKGYQFDIDGENMWSGQNYEERGRQIMANRGDVSIAGDGRKIVVGSVGSPDELAPAEGWHEAHIIAYGTTLIHLIVGRVMSIVVDTDAENRTNDGYLGMQVHVGPPMTIEYKNIRLKEYK